VIVLVDDIRTQVRDRYAAIANNEGSCCGGDCGCADPLGNPAASVKLGYSPEEIEAVPEGSNMGLGCGNPQAIADLKLGETVLDLGSGGGFDCFLAARQVGHEGRVIGVDMTPDMLKKARDNAKRAGNTNVEFRLGEIEHLPVADNSVDAVISNCVINLSPDKPSVFAETFRVLGHNGRLAVSDVVALRPLPEEIRRNLDAYCGCVSGAACISDIEQMLRAAGFTNISVTVKPESAQFIKDWFPGSGVEEYVLSAEITAVKS
jgi:arsenite methyltransferase